MTDLQLIYKIRTIQQDWWDGDIEMNVALSEIRALFGEWDKKDYSGFGGNPIDKELVKRVVQSRREGFTNPGWENDASQD